MGVDDEYLAALDEMEAMVEEAIRQRDLADKDVFDHIKLQPYQPKVHVIYSAYPLVEDIPVNNLHEVAIEGKVQIYEEYNAFWDPSNEGGPWRTSVFENPTWLELCALADDMIKATNNTHHVYLEDLVLQRIEDGVHICRFSMGS